MKQFYPKTKSSLVTSVGLKQHGIFLIDYSLKVHRNPTLRITRRRHWQLTDKTKEQYRKFRTTNKHRQQKSEISGTNALICRTLKKASLCHETKLPE